MSGSDVKEKNMCKVWEKIIVVKILNFFVFVFTTTVSKKVVKYWHKFKITFINLMCFYSIYTFRLLNLYTDPETISHYFKSK